VVNLVRAAHPDDLGARHEERARQGDLTRSQWIDLFPLSR
jgi:hypothetical protein